MRCTKETVSLTSQAVDHRRPFLFLIFIWCNTVFSIHFTDRGCAFSLHFSVKFLIKENLVHQVWLHRAGLCRGLRGPIVVAWMMRQWQQKMIENMFYVTSTGFQCLDNLLNSNFYCLVQPNPNPFQTLICFTFPPWDRRSDTDSNCWFSGMIHNNYTLNLNPCSNMFLVLFHFDEV